MNSASLLRRPGLSASLDPLLVRRRRALRIAPPAMTAMPFATETGAPAATPDWRDDLRFFVGCYVAGLLFFLIILS